MSTLFERASRVLVGGVNSPVRAFKHVGGEPIFFKSARGAHVVSEDDRTYIDYVLSWGPLILGHADPDVVKAVQDAATKGLSFGAPCVTEIELAERVQTFFPHLEKIRFVNSGTEAVMSAIRLARGVTGRKRILKFNGCYHGHVDALLVTAGSGALTGGKPDSDGVLAEWTQYTLQVEYNDSAAVREAFAAYGADIAAIIVEPVAGNMGVVLPVPGFLETLRQLCSDHGSILIFDEVMTGFRVDPQGAFAEFGIVPDLTCLGKVVGGGMPVGAYGGPSALMNHVAPLGGVYQAGTLSGNPVAMAAGIATLSKLEDPHRFTAAADRTAELAEGFRDLFSCHRLPYVVQSIGTMFSIFLTEGPVQCLADVQRQDRDLFSRFFHHMLSEGIYLAPSPYEAGFLSCVHSREDIAHTLKAADRFWASGQ